MFSRLLREIGIIHTVSNKLKLWGFCFKQDCSLQITFEGLCVSGVGDKDMQRGVSPSYSRLHLQLESFRFVMGTSA